MHPQAIPAAPNIFRLPPDTDVAATVDLLGSGLPVDRFAMLAREMGMNESRLAELAGLSRSTLARRKKSGSFTLDEGERVLRLIRVFELSLDLFDGDEAAAVRWLNTPDPLFQGQAPFEYSRTEPGAHFVRQVIGRLEHGVHS